MQNKIQNPAADAMAFAMPSFVRQYLLLVGDKNLDQSRGEYQLMPQGKPARFMTADQNPFSS
jgi:hypothetical protein